jgi:phosphate/sulfate permease
MFGLDTTLFILLFLCLFLACAFEFVNGFHDTANAVATVIYTNSLPPNYAVVWSGFMNFLGVITGGVGVTMSIIGLLPVDLLIDPNVYHTMSMALAMLLAAIIWNVGTWYFGLPSSSSHTLIGSIIGVGLGYAVLPENKAGLDTVNWEKAKEIFSYLLLAPVVGFGMAIILMFLLRRVANVKGLFKEPEKDQVPPMGIRATLIATCTMVSFMHGKNDGQKGIGLVMLILIAFVPSYFAINSNVDPFTLQKDLTQIQTVIAKIDTTVLSSKEKESYDKVISATDGLSKILSDTTANAQTISTETKLKIRKDVILISGQVKKLKNSDSVNLSDADKAVLDKGVQGIGTLTDYAPTWVIWMISLSLGLGTMIGWKRIVVTIGEKIGKQHLTYAQGAVSELVAAITIGISSNFKFPVSTTHILSSGIAGSMVASKGIKNLQSKTIKNIGLAWILTLPVSILLSATLFVFFRWVLP